MNLSFEVQAYFLDRMAASDSKAIKQIIQVHCNTEKNAILGQISINGALPANPWEYEKLVADGDIAGLKIIFTEDTTYLRDELVNARKQ